MATALGWTFSEIDAHTLIDVIAVTGHWVESPPVHIALAQISRRFVGGSSSSTKRVEQARRTKDMTDDQMESERAMLQGLAQQFGRISQGARAT